MKEFVFRVLLGALVTGLGAYAATLLWESQAQVEKCSKQSSTGN